MMSAAQNSEAACRDADPDLFFPYPGRSSGKEAKKICETCVVRHACLEEALRDPGLKGVWGGMTESERLALRRAAS